jgi:hypothetical protein
LLTTGMVFNKLSIFLPRYVVWLANVVAWVYSSISVWRCWCGVKWVIGSAVGTVQLTLIHGKRVF